GAPPAARIRCPASDPGRRTTPSSSRSFGRSARRPPSSPYAVALPLKESVLVDLRHPPATSLPPVVTVDPLAVEPTEAPTQFRIVHQADQATNERGSVLSATDETALPVDHEFRKPTPVRDHDREPARHRLGNREPE